jgi:hypothetical protein
MRPVEQRYPRLSNPGASRSVFGQRRWRRREPPLRVGASAASVARGRLARAGSAGSGRLPHAVPRHGLGACKHARSSGCPGRSGCTGQPACGSAHTRTGGLTRPCTSFVSRMCWTDSPQRATLRWHRLQRHGVGRGAVVTSLPARDRCRTRLSRHWLGCTASASSPRQFIAPRPHPRGTTVGPRLLGRPAGRPGRRTPLPFIQQRSLVASRRNHRKSKPPPHRQVMPVPDQRSQMRRRSRRRRDAPPHRPLRCEARRAGRPVDRSDFGPSVLIARHAIALRIVDPSFVHAAGRGCGAGGASKPHGWQ